MKILIGTDGSQFSRAAIDECCRLFVPADVMEFKIVSVMEALIPPETERNLASTKLYQRLTASVKDKCRQDLKTGIEQLRAHFPDGWPNILGEITEGPPARVLLDIAKKWQADLIVVGSHGRGFWSRALLGSVSRTIVHHAPCSVLVVKSRAERGGQD